MSSSVLTLVSFGNSRACLVQPKTKPCGQRCGNVLGRRDETPDCKGVLRNVFLFYGNHLRLSSDVDVIHYGHQISLRFHHLWAVRHFMASQVNFANVFNPNQASMTR